MVMDEKIMVAVIVVQVVLVLDGVAGVDNGQVACVILITVNVRKCVECKDSEMNLISIIHLFRTTVISHSIQELCHRKYENEICFGHN